MKNQDVKYLIILVALVLAFGAMIYGYYSFKAGRYNAQLGTDYTALDIMLGLHQTARDWR